MNSYNTLYMKKYALLTLLVLPFAALSQTTYSYQKMKFKAADLDIADYYIPLNKNINESNSTLYLSNKPAADQIIASAMKLKSDSLVVEKDGKAIYTVSLSAGNDGVRITSVENKSINTFTLANGVITANRAIEIAGGTFGKSGKGLVDGILYYNKQKYEVISNEDIIEQLAGFLNELQN
jgi:hypothetical protein